MPRLVSLLTALALLAACGGGSSGDDGPSLACPLSGAKQDVLGIMETYYFWNDEPAQQAKYSPINLGAFTDLDDLLDFLRFEPDQLDRGFTYYTTVEQDNQLLGEGQFVGFGLGIREAGSDALEITQVFAGSPASAGGLQRGYRILRIGESDVADLLANDELEEAFGPPRVGFSQTFRVENLLGVLEPVTLVKAVVTIDPVPDYDVFSVDDTDIGYLEFGTFITPAFTALAEAFAFFAQQDVRYLIVDLRYNGGGLVNVADFFASLLAGPVYVGEVFSETHFNSDLSDLDFTTLFSDELNSLDLELLVFITTEDTASASELVINGLNPYLDVALVGDTTFGKPVGQIAVDFCEETLRMRPVAFEKVNADGDGGYFAGLDVDCEAEDDVAFTLGDPDEASLDAALTYVTTGNCPVAAAAALRTAEAAPSVVAAPLSSIPSRRYAGAY